MEVKNSDNRLDFKFFTDFDLESKKDYIKTLKKQFTDKKNLVEEGKPKKQYGLLFGFLIILKNFDVMWEKIFFLLSFQEFIFE